MSGVGVRSSASEFVAAPVRVRWAFFGAAAVIAVGTWMSTAGGPLLPIALSVGVALISVAFLRPDLGAMIIIALFAIFRREQLFVVGVAIGPGSVKITDALLLATMAGYVLQRALGLQPRRASRAIATSVVSIMALSVLAVVVAFIHRVDPTWIFLEFRQLLNLLLVFPLVDAVHRSRAAAGRTFTVVFCAALVQSLIVVWDYRTGRGSVASFTDGAIRVDSVPIFPMLGVVWAYCISPNVTRNHRRWLAAGASVMAVAITLTFLRGAWIAVVISLLTAAVLTRDLRSNKLTKRVAIGATATAMVIAIVSLAGIAIPAPSIVHNVTSRAASIGDSGDVSQQYRLAENDAAEQQILRSPIIGSGLGSPVTFVSPMYSPEYNAFNTSYSTVYLHNSWLWLGVKLGVLGIIAFVVFLSSIGLSATRIFRGKGDPLTRAVGAATLASLVLIVAFALSGPHLTIEPSTCVLALLATCAAVQSSSTQPRGSK